VLLLLALRIRRIVQPASPPPPRPLPARPPPDRPPAPAWPAPADAALAGAHAASPISAAVAGARAARAADLADPADPADLARPTSASASRPLANGLPKGGRAAPCRAGPHCATTRWAGTRGAISDRPAPHRMTRLHPAPSFHCRFWVFAASIAE